MLLLQHPSNAQQIRADVQAIFNGGVEVDCDLHVLEGAIPDDIYGHVFFNSTCGTVNSAINGMPQFPGLPIPEHYPDNRSETNREYGANLFNGDSLLLRFDFNQKGRVCYKTSVLKTPCYYADLATKRGTKWYEEGHEFKMMGIARQSWKFGSSCTAFLKSARAASNFLL